MKNQNMILIAALLLLVALAPFASAQAPFRLSPATQSYEYSSPVRVPFGSVMTPRAVLVAGTNAGVTAIVTQVSGDVTNVVATKALTTTDRAIALSNVWLFAGDFLTLSGVATNESWVIIAEEQ